MSAADLEGLWSRALDAAVTAALDADCADMLDHEFCTLELRRIRAEREWLARFEWPSRRPGRRLS